MTIAKNSLNGAQKFKVCNWLIANHASLAAKPRDEQAKVVSEGIGFQVTEANLRACILAPV